MKHYIKILIKWHFGEFVKKPLIKLYKHFIWYYIIKYIIEVIQIVNFFYLKYSNKNVAFIQN
jgi:hypothetical protein